MKKRKRIYYTPEQKSLIWGRDKQGVSLHHITRMFESYLVRHQLSVVKLSATAD